MENSLDMENYDLVYDHNILLYPNIRHHNIICNSCKSEMTVKLFHLAQKNCQEIDFNNSLIWQNGSWNQYQNQIFYKEYVSEKIAMYENTIKI